jgi:hypothetical protein
LAWDYLKKGGHQMGKGQIASFAADKMEKEQSGGDPSIGDWGKLQLQQR